MKSKLLFIIVLFLIAGNKANAQIDTLKVHLEKNKEYKYGVDLVFENNSNDTIFLFSGFENFTKKDEIPTHSGINILFFHNGDLFKPRWGDNYDYDSYFVFSKKRTLIYPKSKVKLVFNLEKYLEFLKRPTDEKFIDKYEVSFFMNYSFAKYLYPESAVHIKYFETNRITMVEPSEETEMDNQ